MRSINKIFNLLLAVILILTSGCFHRMAPTSSGSVTYNKADDRTIYTDAPYGNVSIPGQWMSGKYSKASRQQYLYHKDTATLVVSVGPCSYYPFAKDGMEGYAFVQKYYEVESKYQTQMLEQTPTLLVEDKANRYMIWMVRQDGIDQYYLCGVKDCDCNVCTYRTINLKSRKYSAEKAKEFLREAFLK
jgi:hypothetical protein